MSTARIQQHFHKAASSYDHYAQLQREVARALFLETQPLFPASGIILDAGAGTGYFQELARSHKQYYTVMQYDLAFGMCRQAAEYASDPEFGLTYTTCGSIDALPFGPNSMDGIFSSLTLQWAHDVEQWMHELYQTLKPGGFCCIATLTDGTLDELAQAFKVIDDAPHINAFHSADLVLNSAQQVGFSIKDQQSKHRLLPFGSVKELMVYLKGIGAGKTTTPTRKHFYTRSDFTRMMDYYTTHFSTEDRTGILSSWQILSLILQKPEA